MSKELKDKSIELSKRKLSHFIRNAWHVLEPNTPLEWSWHIQCQADHIEREL